MAVIGEVQRNLTRRKFGRQLGPELLKHLAGYQVNEPRLSITLTRCALGAAEGRRDNILRHRVGLEIPHRSAIADNVQKKLAGTHAVINDDVDLINSLFLPTRDAISHLAQVFVDTLGNVFRLKPGWQCDALASQHTIAAARGR